MKPRSKNLGFFYLYLFTNKNNMKFSDIFNLLRIGKSSVANKEYFEPVLNSSPIIINCVNRIYTIDGNEINQGDKFLLLYFYTNQINRVDLQEQNINNLNVTYNFIEFIKKSRTVNLNLSDGRTITMEYLGSDSFSFEITGSRKIRIKNPSPDIFQSVRNNYNVSIDSIEFNNGYVYQLLGIDESGQLSRKTFVHADGYKKPSDFFSVSKEKDMKNQTYRNAITKTLSKLSDNDLEEIESDGVQMIELTDSDTLNGNFMSDEPGELTSMNYVDYIKTIKLHYELIVKNREKYLDSNSAYVSSQNDNTKELAKLFNKYGFDSSILGDTKEKSVKLTIRFPVGDDNSKILFLKGFGINTTNVSDDNMESLLDNILEGVDVNVSNEYVIFNNINVDKKTSTKQYFFVFNTTMGPNNYLGYVEASKEIAFNPSNKAFKPLVDAYPTSKITEDKNTNRYNLNIRK